MTKLYVGNLPFTATEDSVRTLFAPHGTVEKIALINDRETGRPRGFGFVEMSNADASRAMQELNGKDFDGRPLKISVILFEFAFKSRQQRESVGGGSREAGKYTIVVEAANLFGVGFHDGFAQRYLAVTRECYVFTFANQQHSSAANVRCFFWHFENESL